MGHPEKILIVKSRRFRLKVETSGTAEDYGKYEALRNDIGLSKAIIDEWVRSGSLAASFEPPWDPKPPPIARKPPSQR